MSNSKRYWSKFPSSNLLWKPATLSVTHFIHFGYFCFSSLFSGRFYVESFAPIACDNSFVSSFSTQFSINSFSKFSCGVLVLGDNQQDSQGVLRRWRHAGYTAQDALSWLLKFSRVPASAMWTGRRFRSGLVLLMKEWRSLVVELGCCLSLSECDALVRESARWRLKSSWTIATSLCMILNIRVRRWSCLHLVSSSKPSSDSMAVTLIDSG